MSKLDTSMLEDQFLDYQLADIPFESGTSLVEFWKTVEKTSKQSRSGIRFQTLTILAQAVLTLPHSNADAERLFSMMKKVYTDGRSSLGADTVQSLLSVKVNNQVDCTVFEPGEDLLVACKDACNAYNLKHPPKM